MWSEKETLSLRSLNCCDNKHGEGASCSTCNMPVNPNLHQRERKWTPAFAFPYVPTRLQPSRSPRRKRDSCISWVWRYNICKPRSSEGYTMQNHFLCRAVSLSPPPSDQEVGAHQQKMRNSVLERDPKSFCCLPTCVLQVTASRSSR